MTTDVEKGGQDHAFTELARLAKRSELDFSEVRVFSIPKISFRNSAEREDCPELLSTDF